MKVNKIEYNKAYELKDGLNLLYNPDIFELESFDDKLFKNFIDKDIDLYIGFAMNNENLRIYNKTFHYLTEMNLDFKQLIDLLPLFIFDNKKSESIFNFNNDLKYYTLNKFLKENKNLKIKFIPKILFNIKIDWDSQLNDRKEELKLI